jgi:sterol desaturase/sphingolipid hydroxylase (fatty acid hydroxylase superfamily)
VNGILVLAIVCGVAAAFVVVERLRPGRALPAVRGWWPRALALNAVQVAIVVVAGRAWDGWMVARRPWSADALGVAGGAVAGYLVITFVYYFWHRARHESALLWRLFHQVHHSPSRIEVVTSFYKHPLEILVNGVLSSAICYLVVGLDVQAAAGAVLLSGLAELVYHWNVRTPRWLGFVFQRPESHCVHHQLGRHSHNYSDLPVWDMLFGTFENPRGAPCACGFDDGLEQQLGRMLVFGDVHARRGDGKLA